MEVSEFSEMDRRLSEWKQLIQDIDWKRDTNFSTMSIKEIKNFQCNYFEKVLGAVQRPALDEDPIKILQKFAEYSGQLNKEINKKQPKRKVTKNTKLKTKKKRPNTYTNR